MSGELQPEGIRTAWNTHRRIPAKEAQRFSPERARAALAFHRTLPGYAPTRMVQLSALADALGLGAVYVKDESVRFGLNAFKGLGGSYAIGRILSGRLGQKDVCLSYPQLKAALDGGGQRLTFVTATDGNHGRGVAWAARQFGQEAVVYLPRGSAAERVVNIRKLGARALVTDMGYDDTVRFARRQAEENGWILVQDTAFAGYEEVPLWIMEGYTTLALEALEQLGKPPTHLILQAGVGSMAGAVAGFFAAACGEACPRIIVVEPNGADCFYRTAAADDGKLHAAKEPLQSIMAGLCCGEVCPPAWAVLSETAEAFFAVPDFVAAQGMRVLAAPLPGDPPVISGESGAVGLGLVTEMMRREDLRELRVRLGLDGSARVLCISTEGATDGENYRRIVWDGAYGREQAADG